MSLNDLDVDIDEVDVDQLESQLDSIPDDDTEVPEGEGNEDEDPEPEPEKDPPAPEPSPEASKHQVPVGVLTAERKRANDLQRQLDEANAKLEKPADPEPKAPEAESLRPLTEDELANISDELGDEEAERQAAQRNREIVQQERSRTETAELRKEIDALKAAKASSETRASLVETPELLSWYDAAQGDPNAESTIAAVERLKLADSYMSAASTLYPDNIKSQNEFIQRRVIEDLKIQVKPGSTVPRVAPSISDLPGGSTNPGNSNAERVAQIRAKSSDSWTDEDIDILDQYSSDV